ncbi:hypothetical protein [Brevundimonas naejangsanensis]|uniref:hypothetical protein n=1 Tax=Brevundimonas naejangsanensis TaxID=588932 RepID=UPI00320831DC
MLSNDVTFRILPKLAWRPISNDAREACGFGAFDRLEMLNFSWLNFEIDLGVFRQTES